MDGLAIASIIGGVIIIYLVSLILDCCLNCGLDHSKTEECDEDINVWGKLEPIVSKMVLEKYIRDPFTYRYIHKNFIKSLLPYTKKYNFWLYSRNDYPVNRNYYKNSIEIKTFEKYVTIRYWNKNRIDGMEINFYHGVFSFYRIYERGALIEEEYELNMENLAKSFGLFYYYHHHSPYVKRFNLVPLFLTAYETLTCKR